METVDGTTLQLLTGVCMCGLVIFTLCVRVPQCVRMLNALMLATVTRDSAFEAPLEHLGDASAVQPANNFYIVANDDGIFMGVQDTGKWRCVDVERIATQSCLKRDAKRAN